MFGECMCMVVYLILKYVVNKEDPEKFDGEALPMNPLVLWPVSILLSICSTNFVNEGSCIRPGRHGDWLYGTCLYARHRHVPNVEGLTHHLLWSSFHSFPWSKIEVVQLDWNSRCLFRDCCQRNSVRCQKSWQNWASMSTSAEDLQQHIRISWWQRFTFNWHKLYNWCSNGDCWWGKKNSIHWLCLNLLASFSMDVNLFMRRNLSPNTICHQWR